MSYCQGTTAQYSSKTTTVRWVLTTVDCGITGSYLCISCAVRHVIWPLVLPQHDYYTCPIWRLCKNTFWRNFHFTFSFSFEVFYPIPLLLCAIFPNHEYVGSPSNKGYYEFKQDRLCSSQPSFERSHSLTDSRPIQPNMSYRSFSKQRDQETKQ
jgi:hypothetical protein